jgi:hypothetical protein
MTSKEGYSTFYEFVIRGQPRFFRSFQIAIVFRETLIKPLVCLQVAIQRVKETVASLQVEEPLSLLLGPLFFDPHLKDLQDRDLLVVREEDPRTFITL